MHGISSISMDDIPNQESRKNSLTGEKNAMEKKNIEFTRMIRNQIQ